MSRQVYLRLQAAVLFGVFLTWVAVLDSGVASAVQTREYATCMRLARVSPHEGFESALAWIDSGGGGAAKHCAAVALFSMGQYGESAVRFRDLALSIGSDTAARADLLSQSGQAWHQAGDIDRSFAAYSAALNLAPRSPEIRVDRAMVLAERGRYREAVEDLNIALDVDAGAVEALVLRASAHRYLDALDLAFADASRALELSPLHPEALLERGIVARIQGRKNAARRDWLNLLKYYEGTPAGDAAQRNLERLDVSAK